jgi:hypothetical protein
MTARRILLALGSLWDLVRFFLVLSLLLLLVRSAGARDSGMISWLLLAATGNLLVPVGGLMLALFPGRYGNLLGLLRLGKAMSIFSFMLLVVSGSLAAAAGITVLRVADRVVTGTVAALLLFVVDIAFLVLLLVPDPGGASIALADLSQTDAKDGR